MRWSERACGVNLLRVVSVLLKSTTKSQDSQPSKVTDQLVHMPIRMLATSLPPKPHECELQPHCARKGGRRARARARGCCNSAGSKSCTMPAVDRGEGLACVCSKFNTAGTLVGLGWTVTTEIVTVRSSEKTVQKNFKNFSANTDSTPATSSSTSSWTSSSLGHSHRLVGSLGWR